MAKHNQMPHNDRCISNSMATTISLMKSIACKLVILISSAVKAYSPLTSETNEGGIDKDALKKAYLFSGSQKEAPES